MKLFRGTEKKITNSEKDNRYLTSPRKPTNTHPLIHEIADAWFFKEFNIHARSKTIFVSTDIKQAQIYTKDIGTLLEVTPIGSYKLIFSPEVNDFLDHVIEINTDNPQDIESWLNSKHYQLVDNVSEIPENFSGEVMLYCEKYQVTVV